MSTRDRVAEELTLYHSSAVPILRCRRYLQGLEMGGGFCRPSAIIVCDRAPHRSGGVSDPLPNAASTLPPDPGGSLTPPLRTCLFTWHAALHASRARAPCHVHRRRPCCANTRPSHAAAIRFAGRAACRIDRGETCSAPMSLPSRLSRMHVGSIVGVWVSSTDPCLSLAPGRHGIRPRCGGRDTGRDPGGVSSPFGPPSNDD